MSKETLRKQLDKTFGDNPYILRTDPRRQQLDGLSAAVIANFDSEKTGPAGMFYVGRKAAYPKDNYITWLVNRITAKGEPHA